MTDPVNVPREAVERFKDALENMPDVFERHTKGQKFNAYDLDDDGGSKAVCIGPITSRPLSLFSAPADVAELVEASLKLAAHALAAAPKAEPVELTPSVYRLLQLADCALANVTAFEADARLIMGNTNYAITDNARSEIRQFLLATPEAPKVEQEPVNERLYAALKDYTLSNMGWEDDPHIGYPLVDLVSNDGADISTGRAELRVLADHLAEAITHPTPASDELLEALEQVTMWLEALGPLKGGCAVALEDAQTLIAKHKGPQS